MTVGRLTYTSFDALRGGDGGWQVKQEEGVSALDHARALELVATTFDLLDPPSRFPSTAEIAGLPRRLQVGRCRSGSILVVHSAPAGPDATGRPGNVFNHVLVVSPSADDPFLSTGRRPVELWRSPDWLVPWGPDAVRDAVLAGHPLPRPGKFVDRAAVAGLLSECDKAGTAAVGALLDAVGAALAGGPPVLVLIDSQDDAVLMLGVAAMLAGPLTGRTLTFSTWERAFGLRGRRDLPSVSLVPRADLPALVSMQAVVLDPASQQPSDGWVWPTAVRDRTVPVSAWSVLGTALCGLAAGDVLERLAALDELADLNPRAADAAALWPLAVAIAEWTLPGAERATELLVRVGLDLIDDEQTRVDVQALRQRAAGTTALDAAEALTRLANEDGRTDELLVEFLQTYFSRALTEPDFLTGLWPPALPVVDARAPTVRQAVTDCLSSGLGDLLALELPPVEKAVRLLRLCDLAELLEVGADLAGAVCTETARLTARMLFGPLGAQVLQHAEPLAVATLARLLPELEDLVGKARERAGTRLPQHLRSLLLDRLGASTQLPPALLTELAVLAAPDRQEFASLRVEAVLGYLGNELPVLDDAGTRDRTRTLLEHCSFGRPWDVDDLLRIQAALGTRDDVDLQDAVRAVLEQAEPGTAPANQLANFMRSAARNSRPLDEGIRQLAEVHHGLAPGWHLGGPDSTDKLADLVAYGLAYLDRDAQVPADTARRLSPCLLVAAVLALAWIEQPNARLLASRSSRRLSAVSVRLPDLALSALEGLPLLRDAMDQDPTVLPALFVAVARSEAEQAPGPGAMLWRAALDPPAVRIMGRQTLGEALLAEALCTMSDAEQWLAAQLDAVLDGLPPGSMRRVRMWAATLAPPAAPRGAEAAGGWAPTGRVPMADMVVPLRTDVRELSTEEQEAPWQS